MVSHLFGGGLTWPDYAVLFLSLGALVAIGLLFSGDQLGRSLLDLAQDGDCAIGSWGGWRPGMGGDVTVTGATSGATAAVAC